MTTEDCNVFLSMFIITQRKDKIPELQTVKPAEVQVQASRSSKDCRLDPVMTEQQAAVWSASAETRVPTTGFISLGAIDT